MNPLIVIVMLLFVFGLALFFTLIHAKPKLESRSCPMCKVGTIEYEVTGAYDQLTFMIDPCEECGYAQSGLTEDVLWPK